MTQAQMSERPWGHPRGRVKTPARWARRDEPGGGKVRRTRALGGMGGVSAPCGPWRAGGWAARPGRRCVPSSGTRLLRISLEVAAVSDPTYKGVN